MVTKKFKIAYLGKTKKLHFTFDHLMSGNEVLTNVITFDANPIREVDCMSKVSGKAKSFRGNYRGNAEVKVKNVAKVYHHTNTRRFTEEKTAKVTDLHDAIKTNLPKPEQFLVYPNPMQEKITVRLKDENLNTYNVTLMDLNGRKLSTKAMQGKDQLVMPAAQLENGIYLLRITDDLGKVIDVHKLVKN